MDAQSELLIGALRRCVAGDPAPLCMDVDWHATVNLAAKHMLLPLLYDGLNRSPREWEQVPQPVQKLLRQSFLQAVYVDTRFTLLREQLGAKLREENVPHIFLKGACLKNDYPNPALHTMCDMDVLVYTRDYGKIRKIALSLGAQPGHSDGNHRNYTFPGGVTVEFHPNLLHHGTPVGTQINPGWQYARDGGDPCAMELTEEGLYLNTICHLANHFVAGGVGVRFVLDVWVLRHLRKAQPDRDFVEAELARFGLLDFGKNVEALGEKWFSQGSETAVPDGLEEYILTSGSHGVSQRAMLNAVALSPGGSRTSALMKKAFYSREELEDRFPWCKGKPWLLPAAWCTRACRAVTRHGGQIRQWSAGTGKLTQEEIRQQKQMLADFGISIENT